MVGTYRWGMEKQYITSEEWFIIEEVYPMGPDNFWIGSPPFRSGPSSGMGEIQKYIVFFNVMHDTIPIADPVNHFQYGFVFDRDADTENNYEPHPSFPYDFFQDTDYWIVATYDPAAGWSMEVTDATDSMPTPVSSDARMIIVGNTLIVLVPRSEFQADYIGYRMSAYRHPGGWGMTSGDWDGDFQPPVADGLRWVDVGDYTP
jgi:hypothetical protein